jgi:carbon starvation protein
VGYGAMLAEGFVAFISLVTIMIVSSEAVKGVSPGKIYGNGIGEFLTILIGKENLPFAITFGAMAFSTFVFDTLDVSLRLGRYIIQELTGIEGKIGAIVGTISTIAIPFISVLLAPKGSWNEFWTLFGASNQLLAALTLLSITIWLYQSRKRIAFTLLPMLFVLIITIWALGSLLIGNFQNSSGIDVKAINGIAALVLLFLAIFLVLSAIAKVHYEKSADETIRAIENETK